MGRDLGIVGRIIPKWMLDIYVSRNEPFAVFCERGNAVQDYLKGGEFIERPSNFRF
jgi:hypothetical protein